MLFNRSPQTSQVSSACRGWIFPSRQHQSHLCTNIGFFEIGARKRLQAAPPILTSLLEGEIRLADPRGDRLQGLSHRADYRNHVRSGCWGSVFCFKQGILWDRLRFSSRLRWVFGHRFWAGWWVYFVESPYTQTFATTGHPFNTDSTLPRETYLVIVSIYSIHANIFMSICWRWWCCQFLKRPVWRKISIWKINFNVIIQKSKLRRNRQDEIRPSSLPQHLHSNNECGSFKTRSWDVEEMPA